MSATRPPAWFEALLRRAGRATRVGDAAVDDLRREHAAWVAESGRGLASVRYALAATALALRLFVEGRRVGGPPRASATRDLLQDLRFGVRTLARSPGFTVTAAVTFALGVGATTAIFAAVHAILLEPLPYPESDELVRIEVNTGGPGWYGSSMPEYFDFGEQLGALESVGAYTVGAVTMGDTLSPVRVPAAFASASLLPMLGVEPLHGRVFRQEEETSDNNRFVVLSHGLWREAYGADPAMVGRTVRVGGFDFQVLGIMPPGFAFPDEDVRAWIPFGMNRDSPNPRMNHYLAVVGRLGEGETKEQAAAQLDAYTLRAREAYPEIYSERGFRARLQTLHASVTGEVRTPLVVLLSAVVLVLLIACVNVANLFLARAQGRQREMAVRAALGASSARLVRQLTTEGLLLALCGGLMGLGIARIALSAFVTLAPPSIPRLADVRIAAVPLLGTFLVITMAGLILGAIAAARAAREAADGSLAHGGRGLVARRAHRRTRRTLVASQIALACVVVVGAGLMLRTLHNLRALDAGFDPEGVLALVVTPLPGRHAEPERRVAFWEQVTERLGAIPGVTAVGATNALPLSGQFSSWSIRVEGRTTTSIGDAPDGFAQFVTPGAFDALGIRLVRGRTFTADDRAQTLPVVVVSEAFAERFWPGEDPIGKQMKVFSDRYPWLEVVGVVADLRHDALEGEPQPMWYVPHAQAENAYGTPLSLVAVVRTSGDPEAIAQAAREAVRVVDPTAPVSGVRTLAAIVDAAVAGRSFTYDLLQSFGLVAVLLACVGVYGVASLSVAERQAEIGLRKALGADHAAILGIVARETLVTVSLGAATGLLVALAASRVMGSLLYGVHGGDPLTLASTLLILIATASIASTAPVLRALRIDPLDSLRDGA